MRIDVLQLMIIEAMIELKLNLDEVVFDSEGKVENPQIKEFLSKKTSVDY